MYTQVFQIHVPNWRVRELFKCLLAIQKTTNEPTASNYTSDRS